MKKRVVSCLFVVFTILAVIPRSAEASVQFGIKAGGNMAKVSGSDLDDLEGTLTTKVGFVGGIFLLFNFGKVLSIQTEGLYTVKGASVDYTDMTDPYTAKLYGNYLEFPVLLKVRIPIPIIQPFIVAGPAFGFMLSDKITVDGEEIPLDETLFKKSDVGAIVGAGFHLGRSFMIDVRYSQGLQAALDVIKGDTDLDLKQGVWSATIGIAF
jgi:hypothetical protein